jgi:hypothetical protein
VLKIINLIQLEFFHQMRGKMHYRK